MTAASQKRMLTAPNSKLTKTDLTETLRKTGAWETLPLEKRQQLYSLLPPPLEGEPPYDPEVNPLESSLGREIEDELRKWQEDLKAGRESKKWRDEAMQAGRDRRSGKFDDVLRAAREGRSGEGGVGGNDERGHVTGGNGEVRESTA